ncbi:MAG: DUF4956 domain-containing protein [Bacteroidota bacterium]
MVFSSILVYLVDYYVNITFMFDIELMNFNPETPSFGVMLITALLAFFLSSLIGLTYQFTTKSIYRRAHFIQALTLIGIVTATILQAIGESVAIGLGIIGALSIIRFRTSLNDPRNITFMFASLGVGIACGVMGYAIALTGTLVFCLGAIVLRFSPLSDQHELIGTLRIRVPIEGDFRTIVEQKLKALCKSFELDRLRFVNTKRNIVPEDETEPVEVERIRWLELVYLVSMKNATTITVLEEHLQETEGLEGLRMEFQNQPTKL